MALILKVEGCSGMSPEDAMEEMYQLGMKLDVFVQMKYNDVYLSVYPDNARAYFGDEEWYTREQRGPIVEWKRSNGPTTFTNKS